MMAEDNGPGITPGFLQAYYPWVIVALGVLHILGSIGFARFRSLLILPTMKEDLGLTHTQMGLLGSGNFVGSISPLPSWEATGRANTAPAGDPLLLHPGGRLHDLHRSFPGLAFCPGSGCGIHWMVGLPDAVAQVTAEAAAHGIP